MGFHACALLLAGFLLGASAGLSVARADEEKPAATEQPNLVKQANAPISSILQLRLQNTYVPRFRGLEGEGNTLTVAVTMPFPKYRLLPLPQLSLLTVPAAVTLPGNGTAFGDVRFLDIAVFQARRDILWGVGPTFVFPTAGSRSTGQGKWQAGPAAAIAFVPEKWLIGVLAQNPISFAGDAGRAAANALVLQPFVTYQLGNGWFVRSQPQMVFNWKSGRQILPLDLGVGRVFRIGRQDVNCFVEPFWNITHDGPSPEYGIQFGLSLLYPNFWNKR